MDSTINITDTFEEKDEVWQRRSEFNKSENLGCQQQSTPDHPKPPVINTQQSIAETEDSDYDTVTSRTPLRKKACFAPVPITIESNTPSVYTPDSNASSPKKLTSILRNKVTMAVKRSEKPREHKLRAFVGFLFLGIVFLIGFAYIYYTQILMQRLYYERLRFMAEERVIRIFDDNGVEAMKIDLAQTLPTEDKAYDCRKKDRALLPEDAVCVEWMNRARLTFSRTTEPGHSNLQCYRITWKSLSRDFHPTDCFDMSTSYWFGGGTVLGNEEPRAGWPLNPLSVPLSPFVTTGSVEQGPESGWGPILHREFLTSKASSLIIDESVPLWISVNHNNSQQLCVQSRANAYPYVVDGSQNQEGILSYNVCTSPNLASLEMSLADKTMWDGLRKNEMEVLKKLIEDPIWRFQPKLNDNSTVDNLTKFINDIMAVVWTSPGYLLIDNPWEEVLGDWDFDSSRFQGLDDALEIIHRKGFKVAASVHPYVSTFSATYKDGLDFTPNGGASKSGVWLSQTPEQGVPALTSFRGQNSIALPDVSSPEVSDWVADRLKRFMTTRNLDALFVVTTTADVLPRYRSTSRNVTDPSKLGQLFLEAARKAGDVIGVTAATEMPRIPTLVSLSPIPSTWQGLETLLPTILNLGVIGYPFLLPPPVGGSDSQVELPQKELYMRWLQLNTFLPVIQYSLLPSAYDTDVEKLASELAALRHKVVLPLLQKHGEDSIINGLPLVRPLWMLDPYDPNTHNVADEFCLGDDLLVAPVLKLGQRERDIYLPKGVWKDGIDGTLRKGGRWIHNHKVKVDNIPYFHKMPEGVRM